MSAVDWKGGCKEKITEENLSTAKRTTAPLCACIFLQIYLQHPWPSLSLCLLPSIIAAAQKRDRKKKERKKLHLAHVKRAALQKNRQLSKTLFFLFEISDSKWGYFIYLFILQFYHHKKNVLLCISLQERAHFESIGHHLGKLGEEGKIGHRVIDLTRPEDLDGKVIFRFQLNT